MKLRSKKGFTLMEMLIVVGIIAVLVAVSIPVFTSQLEKAREAADIANMRSAKAEGVALYLTEEITADTTRYYDAATGKLQSGTNGIKAYGKGTAADGGSSYENYTKDTVTTNQIIAVTISPEGNVTLSWTNVAN